LTHLFAYLLLTPFYLVFAPFNFPRPSNAILPKPPKPGREIARDWIRRRNSKVRRRGAGTYFHRNSLAAIFALDHMLDNGIPGGKHLIYGRDAVECEAHAEEVDNFVEEGTVFLIRL
jgi:hypothetical protein